MINASKLKTFLLATPSENRFFSTKTDLAPKERIFGPSWYFANNQIVIIIPTK